MRTFDGLQLNVRTYGPRTAPVTVVLAHCWTSDHDDWRYQIRDLMREFGHDVRIVAWDHRGHGASDPAREQDCTVENLARDMAAVIEQYAPNGPIVLAGHSIGGMAMMQLARQRPDLVTSRIAGALFCNTSSGDMDKITLGLPEMGPFLRAQIPRMLALRSRTLTRRARRRAPIIERTVMKTFVFGRRPRVRDLALAVDGLINCPGATMVGFYHSCMKQENTEALHIYDGIPAVVLVGSRDLLTPWEHARRIAANVKDAELIVAPGAGHMLPLERDQLVSGVLVRLVRTALRSGEPR